MIFASDRQLEIGQRHVIPLVRDHRQLEYHRVPCVVLREATFDEWKAQLVEQVGRARADIEGTVLRQWNVHQYFYEVSMD